MLLPAVVGVRLGAHGNRAARRAVGLEAALVDHSTMRLTSLDPSDTRQLDAEVAGPAALVVAKVHKIHDRLERPDRLIDKDAADVFRLMQSTRSDDVAATLRHLAEYATAGPPTRAAIDFLRDLFGSRRGQGIAIAARALRIAMPEARVIEVSVAWTTRVLDAL